MEIKAENKYAEAVLSARKQLTLADAELCDALAKHDDMLAVYEEQFENLKIMGGDVKEMRQLISGRSELMAKKGSLLKLLALTPQKSAIPSRGNDELDDV